MPNLLSCKKANKKTCLREHLYGVLTKLFLQVMGYHRKLPVPGVRYTYVSLVREPPGFHNITGYYYFSGLYTRIRWLDPVVEDITVWSWHIVKSAKTDWQTFSLHLAFFVQGGAMAGAGRKQSSVF